MFCDISSVLFVSVSHLHCQQYDFQFQEWVKRFGDFVLFLVKAWLLLSFGAFFINCHSFGLARWAWKFYLSISRSIRWYYFWLTSVQHHLRQLHHAKYLGCGNCKVAPCAQSKACVLELKALVMDQLLKLNTFLTFFIKNKYINLDLIEKYQSKLSEV